MADNERFSVRVGIDEHFDSRMLSETATPDLYTSGETTATTDAYKILENGQWTSYSSIAVENISTVTLLLKLTFSGGSELTIYLATGNSFAISTTALDASSDITVETASGTGLYRFYASGTV